ncbi:MAG: hypothetical protein IT320_08910 [Anaerolineae bacterium]|nr:hypothetical protein [Anaerolineae bacterium]
MTGYPLLDWAIIGVSLFNTIVLLWLGLIVLLNADRRNGGVILMGGGLLLGGTFFVTHTAILGQSLTLNNDGLNFWWQFGWIPVTAAPYIWYVVILWFSGFWSRPRPRLFNRHRPWLMLTTVVGAGLLVWMLVANPIPNFESIITLDTAKTPNLYGVPLVFIIAPPLMVICIGLSIDVLLHPAPAEQVAVAIGRQRARPWLLGTSGLLLAVSLLVCAFVLWVFSKAEFGGLFGIRTDAIGWFDLALSLLIAVGNLSLGQAIVAHEVFTGRILPRQRLNRQWRIVLLIALILAAIVSWSLLLQLRPIYGLLLTVVLMVGLIAVYSWRTFEQHEALIRALRPFVSSHQTFAHALRPRADGASRAQELLDATCTDVLNSQRALLVPLGPFAALAGDALASPISPATAALSPPPELRDGPVLLAPDAYPGYQWAIPLWAERGLIGGLLLGPKLDGGLYSQEEIDIAQASGERIIDMLVSETMTERLLKLQRKRTATNRVIDLATRRTLHDEVLPALHHAILQISALPDSGDALASLTSAHQQISNLIRIALVTLDDERRVGLVDALRALVDQEFGAAFERIDWRITERALQPLDSLTLDVVLNAVREFVRNAALHARDGKSGAPLHLAIEIQSTDALYIIIRDDGVGIDREQAAEPSGHNGLALHRTLLNIVGGECYVEPCAEGGTQVTIVLPWQYLPDPE